jgi:hypothetical protein
MAGNPARKSTANRKAYTSMEPVSFCKMMMAMGRAMMPMALSMACRDKRPALWPSPRNAARAKAVVIFPNSPA